MPEQAPANAGTSSSVSVCSNGVAINLLDSLGGTPAGGGAWSGGLVGGMYDPAVNAPGPFTYTVTGVAPCANATATVTVAEQAPANAGTSSSVSVCSNGVAINLLDSLGGTPAGGGAWSGGLVGGMYDPAVNAPGPYTYTITGVAPCANATATVTVTEVAPANAGTSSSVSVCSNGVAINLLDSLGGTPAGGGAWSGGLVGGMYDPAVNAPGPFTYTVTGTAPCANATATVTVAEQTPVDAGTSSSVSVCSNGVAVNLLDSLGGTPAGGGAWSGGLVGGMYDPAVNAPGPYTYTVTGTAPCANATATVTVAEQAPANAGTSSSVSVCSNGVAINLLDSLGGTPAGGGAWSGGLVGGMYDPAVNAPGPYTYTVTGVAPCANATATVTVAEQAPANAGTSSSVSVCSNGVAINLLDSLGGTPAGGGTWSGGLVGGMYDPAVNAPGPFTYTITGVAPCANATATVTVTEVAPADAGTSSSVSVCANGVAINLLDSLGGTTAGGGTWSGGLVGGMYNPAVNAPGPYTYTVTGVAPCANATATVTVAEQTPVDAGTSSSVSVCSNGVAINLLDSLGGTPAGGGTWSGGLVGGMYDPAVNAPGPFTYTITGVAPCANATATVTVAEQAPANAGTSSSVSVCSNGVAINLLDSLGGTPAGGGAWSGGLVGGMYDPAVNAPGPFTYTVTGVAPCANATATVTVAEQAPANAGTSSSVSVCSNGVAINLLDSLGGTPAGGGAWSGGLVGGMYDPAVNAPGPFTYTITGVAPCANATATVTVAEIPAAYAGSDTTFTLCSSNSTTNLFFVLTGAQAGGTWTGPGGVFFDGTYEPSVDPEGPHIYTVAGSASCADDQAVVMVVEVVAPNAGRDTSITLCSNGNILNLFTVLPTAQPGGTWLAGFSGSYEPGVTPPGVFTYSLPGIAPCVGDQSTVTIAETSTPNAGTDANLTVCDQGAAVNLFNSLGGSPDAGGTWSGGLVGGMYDPAVNAPGPYIYTVTGTSPCGNATATVTVSETGSPNAGTDGAVTVCADGAAIDLFTELGGSPDAGGTWSGGLVGGMFDPAVNAAGNYTYS
ncbi:MAG: hypothetical protein IPI95_00125 [Flavobacteriales bacterium]|nr:hypothetical protein [Flavobacteriales bacterium]